MNDRRKHSALTNILGSVVSGIFIGLLVSVCFIFSDAEIHAQTRAFWFAIFG